MAVERNDGLDRLLDEALGAYLSEEPRQGMEQRILAGMRSASVWPVRIFAGASVAAAAALCGVALFVNSQPEIALAPPPVPGASIAAAAPAVALPRSEPRRERFPTPAPLTGEERAWMILANNGVAAELTPGEIEPIQIEELTIPPLESEGGE